ncbi:MAG: DUF1566 domain-containing protein [Woeseiaceae bacterium]|nr:DUF1566 domain-containing protein [Woeseiaceae bacterium]
MLRPMIDRFCFTALAVIAAGCAEVDPDAASIHASKYRVIDAAACVEDTATGLTWEVKSETAGLHDWRNTYTWFNPNEANNELDYRGTPDGGDCAGSACDTWAFVNAVNAAGHCGLSDWRMPSRDELMSISDLGKADDPPTANLEVFPHMQAAEYWSGYDYGSQYQSAWAWNFYYGHDRVDWKASPKFVRLVRGTAENLQKVKE